MLVVLVVLSVLVLVLVSEVILLLLVLILVGGLLMQAYRVWTGVQPYFSIDRRGLLTTARAKTHNQAK